MAPPETAEPMSPVLKPLSLNKMKSYVDGELRPQSNLLCIHMVQTVD